MVNCSKCKLIKDNTGKFHIFLPDELATDRKFPFELKHGESMKVHVSFEVGDSKLTVTPLALEPASR